MSAPERPPDPGRARWPRGFEGRDEGVPVPDANLVVKLCHRRHSAAYHDGSIALWIMSRAACYTARGPEPKERAMAETARLAVFHGAGKPFEVREYPVPDPEPGAILIKVALANVCGSDLHYWRGELDYAKMGRPLPLNTGHEHVGTVAKLGPGVTTDSSGQPLKVGDRVAYRFFFPCGRCRACLARRFKSCP